MEKKGSILMRKYELGRMLGQGTFAKVHYGRDLKTGTGVAIKMIDKDRVVKSGMIDQIKREISVMKMVSHPNVVELHEVMASKSKIYFVMEYAKGGELFNKVAKGKLREESARKYFQQLIGAVDYCHSRGVSHRDIKPENLLLDEEGNLKVSDFGLSALAECKRQDGLLHTTCGTPAYVAPEVINRRGYDGAKADIWSCGVVLFVLLAGYLPFHDSNLMEMYKKIGKAEFKMPPWFAPEVRKLVSKMLDPNPRTRASMERIMASPWFRKGFVPRPKPNEPPFIAKAIDGVDAAIFEEEETVSSAEEKPCNNLNAFDIISYSSGFDLSGLFVEEERKKKDVRFSSDKPARAIVARLEEVARRVRMRLKKKEGGSLRFEGSKEGRKGTVGIEAEIHEITPDFHFVEMKKSNGDTLEYQKIMENEIRPGLSDIIWTWQGEREQPPLLSLIIPSPEITDKSSPAVQEC